MDFSNKKISKALQYANQIGATYVTVIGENEINTQEIELKEMATGNQEKIPLNLLEETLKSKIKNFSKK